ncbi:MULTISPECIES: hypothetical protein [unclassified Caballeronia]|uniref:hypothetical protein n=1 Tax=unclassified Caballeronia TaxID=2646786 RepID=UPI00285FCA7E|nr:MULTISPECIES: hypothetical protein [unclassified Caballeronia]MDR5817594.1 hypothetical protein [Caballeronia sp. LZ033]MDR5824537.1 hypothetical protein [Caballeronia sp. LZ043]MDR5882430.1 hypothetical protein [Caballeronia sp. LZ032]
MNVRTVSLCLAMACMARHAAADTLTRADGGRYVGQVVNGKADGQGVETRPDGTILKGRFAQDAFVEGTMRSGGWVVPFSACHSTPAGAASTPEIADR